MIADRLLKASKQLGEAMNELVEEQRKRLTPAAIKLVSAVVEMQSSVKYHMAAEVAQRRRPIPRRRKIARKAAKTKKANNG